MLYSKSTGGFYCLEINGARIPADAIEISEGHYQSLIAGQSEGKVISSGEDGVPFLSEPIAKPEPKETLIKRLEASITPRRLREAILGNEESKAFILDVDERIAALRSQQE